MRRLAIVATHPVQYYAPWFRLLARVPNLQVHVLYLFDPSKSGNFDPGFLQPVDWDLPLLEGYSHEFVPNRSASPGTGRFWGLRNPELKKRVLAFRPDAVLVMGYNFWSLLRFIFSWDRDKAPLIFRGDSHRIARKASIGETVRRAAIATVFRRFAAFLYVGQANLRYFAYHGVPAHLLFRAPHAVDIERFATGAAREAEGAVAWRRSLGIPDDSLVVMFAGKFEPKKRPLDLLHAFIALDPKNAFLLMVGSGPQERDLHEAAAGRGNVRFAPFQNQSRMPRTYAACDVFVLPSYGDFETWGLAVNEAMSVGKPAIVSSHVGCAEDLVVPGETGLIFEAGSRESLMRALTIALESRNRTVEWGCAARQRIGRFGYGAAIEGLLAALEYACSKAAGTTLPT